MVYSLLSNVAFVIFSLTLIGLPFYQNGVFFDQGHLIVDVASLGLSFLTLIVLGIRKSKSDVKDKKGLGPQPAKGDLPASSSNRNFSQSLTIYDVAFLVYILLYVLTLFHAADFTRSLIGALDALGLLFPYWVIRWSNPRRLVRFFLVPSIAVASIAINITGIAHAWHALSLPGWYDSLNHDIASVFQYHNAYGSFLGAASLMLLTYLANSNLRKSWFSPIYSGIAALNIAGLVFSNSRGALLFWLVMIVLLLIGSQKQTRSTSARGQLLLFLYITAIGFGAGYTFLHKGLLNANAKDGWMGIAITFLLPVVLTLVVQLLSKVGGQGFVRWVTFPRLAPIGILMSIIIGFVKAHALLKKIHSYALNQGSPQLRFVYWKDGLKIWMHSPVIGWGGNAWHTLYEKYQSFPYFVTKSHSFLVDTAMEIGLIGTVALLVLIWPMIRATVWPYRISANPQPEEGETGPSVISDESLRSFTLIYRSLAVMGMALFLHSLMDWDMSFSYLRILMTVGIAAGVALYSSREVSERERESKWADKLAHLFRTRRALQISTSSVTAIFMAIAAYFGLQLFRANNIAKQAQTVPLSSMTMNLYQTAHKLAPYDSQFVADIAATQNAFAGMKGIVPTAQAKQEEMQALSTYEQAAALAPFDANIQGATASLAYHLGQFKAAYQYAKLAYGDAPFYPANVEIAINGGAVYAMSVAKSNPVESQAVFKNIQNLYLGYLQRDKIIHELPPYLYPSNNYQLPAFAYDSLAATALGLHQPAQAQKFAQDARGSKDAHTADLAQLILLIASNQQNKGVTAQQIQQFVAAHANVQSSYHLLVQALN